MAIQTFQAFVVVVVVLLLIWLHLFCIVLFACSVWSGPVWSGVGGLGSCVLGLWSGLVSFAMCCFALLRCQLCGSPA